MQNTKIKNNGKLFIILTLVIVVVIVLFSYFIYMFTKYDKTEYEVPIGSVLYDEKLEYIKIEGEAYLTQKFDRNYYLYEKKDGDTKKYKLGKNTVLYKEGDVNIYLYGTAYQVLSSGDVDTLGGETKILKSSPTKFFKLDDRKYLIVDTQIKSVDDNILNTKEYAIINLDKKGNPSFSNHIVDFKTIKEMVVSTATFEFDIANEKLIYQDEEIDLKNIIGSSNEYEPPVEVEIDYTDEKLEALQNNIKTNADTIVGYYDQYFNDVVNSVNNLTTSVIGVNDNAIASVTKEDVYYDFQQWVALKSVQAGVTSIDIEYSIFDPTNEYETIYLAVDGPDITNEIDGSVNSNTKNHYLNKNESKYIIRDLQPETSYVIKFVYKKQSMPEETIENTLIVDTRKAEYDLTVTKITMKKEMNEQNVEEDIKILNYELTVDPNYKFSESKLCFKSKKKSAADPTLECEITSQYVPLTGDNIDPSGIYRGEIKITPRNVYQLDEVNYLILDQLYFCVGEGESRLCSLSPLTVKFKFFN